MSRDKQKEGEMFLLRDFLKLLSADKFTLLEVDRERPDFIVTDSDGRKIGVEVTEYHNNNPVSGKHTRREVEEAWNKLRLGIGKTFLASSSNAKLYGFLKFKSLILPSMREHKSFIDELVECVRTKFAGDMLKIREFDGYPLLGKYLEFLRIKSVKCSISWESNLSSGWLKIDQDSLINLVKQKSHGLDSYSSNCVCDKYWLLIASGWRISQSVGCRAGEQLKQIRKLDDVLRGSEFSNVYFYQSMTQDIYEWPEWNMLSMEKVVE